MKVSWQAINILSHVLLAMAVGVTGYVVKGFDDKMERMDRQGTHHANVEIANLRAQMPVDYVRRDGYQSEQAELKRTLELSFKELKEGQQRLEQKLDQQYRQHR